MENEEGVRALFMRMIPGLNAESCDALIAEGFLNTNNINDVIAALEERYGVRISYENLTEENFCSAATVAKMIEELQG